MFSNLASLEGRLRHCVKYKTAKGGRKRCAKFSAGAGKPRGRKKAGILSRFYERSTTKRRAKRVCAKRGVRKGVRRCLKWRSVSAALARKRRSSRRRRGTCLRFGRSKLGKRVCRKFSAGLHRRKKTSGKKKRSFGTAALARRAQKKLIKAGYGKGYVGMHGLELEAPRKRRRRKKATTKRRSVTRRRVARRRTRR